MPRERSGFFAMGLFGLALVVGMSAAYHYSGRDKSIDVSGFNMEDLPRPAPAKAVPAAAATPPAVPPAPPLPAPEPEAVEINPPAPSRPAVSAFPTGGKPPPPRPQAPPPVKKKPMVYPRLSRSGGIGMGGFYQSPKNIAPPGAPGAAPAPSSSGSPGFGDSAGAGPPQKITRIIYKSESPPAAAAPEAPASPQVRQTHILRIKSRCMRFFLNGPAPAPPSAPDLLVSSKTEYYDVEGSTNEEICADIARNKTPPDMGPSGWGKLIEKGTVLGLTRSGFVPRPTIAARENECALREVSVEVDITMILPRWHRKGEPDLVERWDKMADTVKMHEETHAALAVQGGYDLLGDLKSLGVQSCETIEGVIRDHYIRRRKETAARQAEYDKQTSMSESVPF